MLFGLKNERRNDPLLEGNYGLVVEKARTGEKMANSVTSSSSPYHSFG